MSKVVAKRIAGNSSWLVVSNLGTASMSAVLMALVSRMIGPTGIGTIALFAASCGFAQGFISLRSGETVITFASKYVSSGDYARSNAVVFLCLALDFLGAAATVIAIHLARPLLLTWFHIPSAHAGAFTLYSSTIVFTAPIVTGTAVLRLANQFRLTCGIALGAAALRLSIAAFLYFSGSTTLLAVVSLYAFASLVEGVTVLYFALRGLQRLFPSPRPRIPKLFYEHDLFKFQIQGYLRDSVKSVGRYADILLIGLLVSPSQVGFYRICKQMTSYLQAPVDSIAAAAYPEYSRLWFEHRLAELRTTMLRLLKVLLPFAVLLSLVTTLFGRQIIMVLFGSAFLPAAPILSVLIFATSINVVMAPLFLLPQAAGTGKPALIATASALLVQLGAIYLLVPQLQGLGAAWAGLLYTVVWASLIGSWVWRLSHSEVVAEQGEVRAEATR
ncbi:MAG: hypothetical protein C4521_03610 [Actinobacteria bacterium]|nr:MAG: hypothetical protein C4521_03610 [Actinomycetota bacterium]